MRTLAHSAGTHEHTTGRTLLDSACLQALSLAVTQCALALKLAVSKALANNACVLAAVKRTLRSSEHGQG